MGSLDSILVKQGNAQNIAGTIVDDSPVAIRLKYVGTGTVTSVTVTTATNVIMVTSDGGTDTYTFSTYTNMGLLADKINGDGIFECIVLDALRTDETTNSDFITGAKTITSDGYYDMTIDTDTAQNTGNDYIYTYRCSYDRNPGGQKPKGSHRVRLSEVLYNVDVNGVEAKGFQIYEWDAEAKTETVVYQKVSVDATATTVNFASGNQTLDSGVGNDLIVRVKDSTSITDAAGNYLICSYIRELARGGSNLPFFRLLIMKFYMKLYSKFTNYRVILRSGTDAIPLAGKPKVDAISIKFKDNQAEITDEVAQRLGTTKDELVQWVKVHPSFGDSFWEESESVSEDKKRNPYASRQFEAEPRHNITQIEGGTVKGSVGSPAPIKFSDIQMKAVKEMITQAVAEVTKVDKKENPGVETGPCPDAVKSEEPKVESNETVTNEDVGKTSETSEPVSPQTPTITPKSRGGRPKKVTTDTNK